MTFTSGIRAARATARPLGLVVILAAAGCAPAGTASTGGTNGASASFDASAGASAAASVAPSASAAGTTIEDIASATLMVDGGPDFPTAAFDSLWLLAPDGDDQAVVRIDPETNETITRISIPSSPCQGLVATDEAVWTCLPDGAARIDPATNSITGTVPYDVAPAFGRMAFGAGAVWALGSDGFSPANLVRIDPASSEATAYPLGHDGGTIAFGFGAVWITVRDDGLLLRFDPATGEISEHTSGLVDPWTVAAGPDSLWVTLHGTHDARPSGDDPTLVRIDPNDGAVLAEFATGAGSGTYGGVWATADAVWVRAPDAFLVRIDPVTNEVVETISGPASSGDVTVAFGTLWATAVERQTVYRLAP